jgi:ABC-type phosphate transport system substrate-binding protein
VRDNSTSNVRRRFSPGLLLAGLMTACSTSSDPDPATVQRSLVAHSLLRVPTDDYPVLVTASVIPFAAAPAPMAETVSREQLIEREQVVVAVGRNSSQCFDSVVQKAFTASRPDLNTSFVACPDRDAAELMMVGRADFALLSGSLSAREQHAGLRQTRIGVELFALAVSPDFPARSLTNTQVRQVLTGQITDWQQLGYDAGPVVTVIPAERALAERAARALILGDDFAAGAVRVSSDRHVADQILRNPGAIGVVRVTDRPLESGQKLLQIDWTPATPEAFGYSTYPYGIPVHMVTSGQPGDTALSFLQFAQSDDGRELLGRTLCLR